MYVHPRHLHIKSLKTFETEKNTKHFSASFLPCALLRGKVVANAAIRLVYEYPVVV